MADGLRISICISASRLQFQRAPTIFLSPFLGLDPFLKRFKTFNIFHCANKYHFVFFNFNTLMATLKQYAPLTLTIKLINDKTYINI